MLLPLFACHRRIKMAEGLVIRNMNKDDLSQMHAWVVDEGWQPGDTDLSVFFGELQISV